MAGPGRPRGPEPSLRSQWLGKKLRDLRQRNKFTLEQAGEFLQRDPTMLSRYEKAEYPIRRGDVLALLTLYGVSDETLREGLMQLCDDMWRKGWWDPYSGDVDKDFINNPWLESRATRICTYENMVLPGLLQTADYAEILIRNAEGPDALAEQIARWVELRMQRQQVLDREEPVGLSTVIEEWVLRRPIGSTAVRITQLRRLLDAAKLNHIDVRILPSGHGPHAGHLGHFELFEMPDPYPEVGYAETLGGALYVESPGAERFHDAYDSLHRDALGARKSAELISEILNDLE